MAQDVRSLLSVKSENDAPCIMFAVLDVPGNLDYPPITLCTPTARSL